VPLPDDDRRALAARLATTAPDAVDVLAHAVDDGEELREVLVDVDGNTVALTASRVLLVEHNEVRAFDYGEVEVRRREGGLGVDTRIEDGRLVLDVARSTFVRLGPIATGNAPGRASWLPIQRPAARTEPAASREPAAGQARPAGPTEPAEADEARRPASATGPAGVLSGWAGAGAAGGREAPAAGGPPAPPDAARRPEPPQAPPEPEPSSLPPPGWHPDPSGRHWWRWWDGRSWTEHVADGGAPYVDPLPPR
jgi:hypothetical protein